MTPSKLQELYASRAADDGYVGDSQSCRAKTVCKIVEAFPAGKGLDVGSADGSVLAALTTQHQISAVDICAKFFGSLKDKGYVNAVQCDIQTEPLPHDSGSFDWVVCAECLEHVVDTDHVLAEINRVLKPGGRFILTVPNIRTPIGLAMLIVGYPPMLGARYRSGHVRDFTLSTARIALQNNGFKVEKIFGTEFMSPYGFHLSWLARLFPAWSSTIVFSCTKLKAVHYDLEAVVSTEMHGRRASFGPRPCTGL
jgi:2-polyprenyl-3-methyl-5-hydroxy-6-metoxy-1,4-benzoquinol methylase